MMHGMLNFPLQPTTQDKNQMVDDGNSYCKNVRDMFRCQPKKVKQKMSKNGGNNGKLIILVATKNNFSY